MTMWFIWSQMIRTPVLSLAGMQSAVSRDFRSDVVVVVVVFLFLCFSDKSILTILRSKYMKPK